MAMRPDNDLVPKGQAFDVLPLGPKVPLPPEAPEPEWDPLYIDLNYLDTGYPQNLPPNIEHLIDFFKLFFDDTVLDIIRVYTNRHTEIVRKTKRSRPWAPITKGELKAYFTTIIYIGLYLESRIKDYWEKGSKSIIYYILDYISRDRFQ